MTPRFSLLIGLFLIVPGGLSAKEKGPAPVPALAAALSVEKWGQLQNSVDRSLVWLAGQQSPDGSFPTLSSGQPAVTSLCVMAFLSRGHQPGSGPYGEALNRAVDYVLSCQKQDGLISLDEPGSNFQARTASHTGTYDHAISGLMLGEVYGQVRGERAKRVRAALKKALVFDRALQARPKHAKDVGGWRYLREEPGQHQDSDMSVTAWHLMFLRSAKNAEFRVPQKYMDDAVAFISRAWDPKARMFNYRVEDDGGREPSRGTTGAGIVSLSMAGYHNSNAAVAAGNWLASHPVQGFPDSYGPYDEFFYSAYYCSQAAAQLGGAYWQRIFPPLAEVLSNIQLADGSFPPEPRMGDAMFGQCYSTSMAVLAMTPAYQLLPVYQR